MKKLIVLGNCGDQTPQYEVTNFVIDVEGVKILLDTGPAVIRQLYRVGICATDIDLIIITHSHGDHTLGFPYFLFYNFIERNQGKKGPETIPVIALPEVYNGIMNMFSFCYPPGKYPNFNVEKWEASPTTQSTFHFKNIIIKSTPVTHTVPTIAIRLEFDSTIITFSSDTIYDEKLVALAKGSTVLVHEAFGPSEISKTAFQMKHATARDAGKVARDSNVQKLILSHVYSIFMDKKDLLIKEAKEFFQGEILLPSEFEIIKI